MACYETKALAESAAMDAAERKAFDAQYTWYVSPIATGLVIVRDGYTFALSWKIPWGNYDGGVNIQANINGGGWYTPELNYRTTEGAAFTLPYQNFYPYTGTVLRSVAMRVQGAKKFEVWSFSASAQYWDGKGHKKKKTVTQSATARVNFSVSEWAETTYYTETPSAPSLSSSVSSTYSNRASFSWEYKAGSDKQMFVDVQWQTAFAHDYNSANGSGVSYGGGGTTGATGDTTQTESTSTSYGGIFDGHSHVRWVRVRSRGASGASGWVYARQIYAFPNAATNITTTINKASGGYQAVVSFTVSSTEARPIDHIETQYLLAVPASGLTCPSGQSWNAGTSAAFAGGNGGARININDTLDLDECLFVRILTKYNAIYQNSYGTTYSSHMFALAGTLKKPTQLSVTTDTTTYKATVTATNQSAVPDSVLAVIYQPSNKPNQAFVCGIIPHGSSSVTVQCPDWSQEGSIEFGVYAVVGNYTEKTRSDGAKTYSFTPYSGKSLMKSETNWEGGDVPFAPKNVVCDFTDRTGTIRVSWSWSWASATGAELAWADHDDAWESTDEPSTYVVSSRHNPMWNISGLDVGRKWYVRVRFVKESGDTTVYSPWSDISLDTTINLTSAPAIPTLTLSESYILKNGSVTASWAYVSTDGTGQAGAEICDIADITDMGTKYVITPDTTIKQKDYYVRSGSGTTQSPYVYNVIDLKTYELTEDESAITGKIYYSRSGSGTAESPYVYTSVIAPTSTSGLYELTDESPSVNPHSEGYYEENCRIIARTTTQQQISIKAEDVGWNYGETHYLAVRVLSASGCLSNDWSPFVSISIVNPITCTIVSTSLSSGILTEMPLTLTVTGAGSDGTTEVIVERSEPYQILRPDGSTHNGYEGESIFIYSQVGESQITISETIGRFDDGAGYRIIAYTKDKYGQVASDTKYFRVGWEHQAVMPIATAYTDMENRVVQIAIGTPDGTATGDSCDIYRLSIDNPVLVYEGAQFGTTYIDPYPAIGDYCGHRIVYKSVCGDYVTSDNKLAWLDLGPSDGDGLLIDGTVIDFGGEQIHLERNVDLSSNWEKDFKETKYLGGSVVGDWNPAVVRSGSVASAVITVLDYELIKQMRRLAEWPDICHVRTHDGSSYDADIQVSESMSHDKGGYIGTYSLKITRVDSQGQTGMTYSEWAELNVEEYSNESTYAVGKIVWHESELYICIVEISTAEEWNDSHWVKLSDYEPQEETEEDDTEGES